MLDWQRITIGELCDSREAELQTGPFGTQLHAYDYVLDGIPVVPTEAIGNRKIDHSVLPKISFNKAEELRRHWLEPGDILFARRGVQATGHIGYVREFETGFVCGTGAIRLRIRQNSGISPEYVSHILANPVSVAWFKYHAIGATMPNLNEGIIRSFPINLPPIGEQRAIAQILGALDDKIELNRRMNETLEAMARALFKSWFVDFDPVRSNAEGREPRLPKPIADLFPARFIDSEIGEIPEGWEVGSFENIADLVRIPANPFESPDSVFSHYSIPAFDNGQLPVAELGTAIKSTKFSVPAGTVLFSKLNPTIERVWLVNPQPNESAICSTEFLVFRPNAPFERCVLYCLLRSPNFREAVNSMVTGTSNSHQRARAGGILQVLIAFPPAGLAERFEDFAGPILNRALGNRRQSQTLAEMRDALLPKLISGELRVREADRVVAEAAG
jgi:type I restriction enzyme S subunit